MRICFIGNSHTASVKLGGEKEGLPEAAFLAAPRSLPAHLAVEGDRLFAPDDSKDVFEKFCGRSEVTLSEYDVFVIIGMNYSNSSCFELFSTARPYVPGTNAGGYTPISRAAYRKAATAVLERTFAIRTAAKLRPATDAPIFIVPVPEVAETIKEADLEQSGFWSALNLAQARDIHDLFVSMSEVFKERGVQVIPQPETTIVSGAFTDRKFVTGKFSLLGVPRRGGVFDHTHMTIDFGAIIARDVFETVKSSFEKRADTRHS